MRNGVGIPYQNAMLDSMLGSAHDTTAYPATVYVALFTTEVYDTQEALGTECSGTNYDRVAVTNNDTNFPDATGGVKQLATQVDFPTPGASDWGAPNWWAFMDDPDPGEGDVFLWGRLGRTTSFIIQNAEVFIPASTIEIIQWRLVVV